MSLLLSIIWDLDPEIFPFFKGIKLLGTIRWYGILWALSFVSALFIMNKAYVKTGRDKTELDSLFMYTLIGCIAGARIGHCLFYGPYFDEYAVSGELLNTGYLSRPWTILYVWEGGLASHGAGIGLLIACYLFYRKFNTPSYLWIIDRVAITIALAGCLIRFGNFMNSEIIGKPTDASTAIVFGYETKDALERTYTDAIDEITYEDTKGEIDYNGINLKASKMTIAFKRGARTKYPKEQAFNVVKNTNRLNTNDRIHFVLKDSDIVTKNGLKFSKTVYPVTRHPSQLYESISSLIIFLILIALYFPIYKSNPPTGLLIGIFMVGIFTLRFFYEIFKESQIVERGTWALNTGQLLSIPMVIFGLTCIIYAFTYGNKTKLNK